MGAGGTSLQLIHELRFGLIAMGDLYADQLADRSYLVLRQFHSMASIALVHWLTEEIENSAGTTAGGS